jgi:hypothetical protein
MTGENNRKCSRVYIAVDRICRLDHFPDCVLLLLLAAAELVGEGIACPRFVTGLNLTLGHAHI